MGLWVDGGVKALVQAVTWTCPDGMVSFPMTGTAYSRYSSSVQCSLQCTLVHSLGACASLCVLVQLGSGAVVLVPSLPYCVWLKLTVTFFDKCRHSSYRFIATNATNFGADIKSRSTWVIFTNEKYERRDQGLGASCRRTGPVKSQNACV